MKIKTKIGYLKVGARFQVVQKNFAEFYTVKNKDSEFILSTSDSGMHNLLSSKNTIVEIEVQRLADNPNHKINDSFKIP